MSMQVVASSVGKKFQTRWIFKNIRFAIEKGTVTTITGKNGSGKSTLILMIAAYLSPSAGTVRWFLQNHEIQAERLYHHLTIATPYLELIEEFSLEEMIRYQGAFKQYRDELSHKDVLELSGLGANRHKPIKQYSSGMKQRVKLLLAITSRSELLLLDEPCSNLDADSVSWYHGMLQRYSHNRSIVIASNQKTEEYPGCTHFIELCQGCVF